MENFQEFGASLVIEMTKFHSLALTDTDQLTFVYEIECLINNLVLCFGENQDERNPEACFEKINTSVKNISAIIKSFFNGGN